ncbi:MAG: hypothetical protein AB7S26_23805 [Sandaracinaceae bacterium]
MSVVPDVLGDALPALRIVTDTLWVWLAAAAVSLGALELIVSRVRVT